MATNQIRVDRVLAIDPGKATGLAWLRQESGKIYLDESYEATPDDVIDMIRPTLADWKPAYAGGVPLRVVIERFTINQNTAMKSQEAAWALETIGAVKQAIRDVDYPMSAVVWQSPADAKNAFTNQKLKDMELWHRGGEGHALDAIRHGSLYLAKVRWAAKGA